MLQYNFTNKIRFTSISEKLEIPRCFKGQLSMAHAALIAYVAANFANTKRFKQQVVDAINVLSYVVMSGQLLPAFKWSPDDPINTAPKDISEDDIKSVVGAAFLEVDAIEWDVEPSAAKVSMPEPSLVAPPSKSVRNSSKSKQQSVPKQLEARADVNPPVAEITATTSVKQETQKEDLYIKAPFYPRFDFSKPWLSQQDGPDKLVIYTTLPEIPTKQNEISVTTDIEKMTDSELLALYPTKLIRTRAAVMYEPVGGLTVDPDLGVMIPVAGFTDEQLIDNIIRYPHFYKLQRIVNGDIRSFYTDIEINGELIPIQEAWDSLPESNIIPKQSEYIKEYVVRRYLLEKEKGLTHNYPMYGTLNQFLTLFMPIEGYTKFGYNDPLYIAKQCVNSRVSFKRSRNPILRRLGINV